MRRHLYLITDSPNTETVGEIESRSKPYTMGKKNQERVIRKRNLETGDTYQDRVVGMGYADFDSHEHYEDTIGDVIDEKLGEIDAKHLEKAGVELESEVPA